MKRFVIDHEHIALMRRYLTEDLKFTMHDRREVSKIVYGNCLTEYIRSDNCLTDRKSTWD